MVLRTGPVVTEATCLILPRLAYALGAYNESSGAMGWPEIRALSGETLQPKRECVATVRQLHPAWRVSEATGAAQFRYRSTRPGLP